MFRGMVLALVIALALGACSEDPPTLAETRAEQARDVAKKAGLSDGVQDLLADAATSATQEFTVRYKLAVGNGTTTVVQDPPRRRRIDLVLGNDDAAVTRTTITNDDGNFVCTRTGATWECKKSAAPTPDFGPMALGDIEQTTQDLAAARKNYTFRLENRTVAGTRARCLVTQLKPGQTPDPSRGERGVLCISPEGVPLVIQGGQTAITATSYTPSAKPSAFVLPAKAS